MWNALSSEDTDDKDDEEDTDNDDYDSSELSLRSISVAPASPISVQFREAFLLLNEKPCLITSLLRALEIYEEIKRESDNPILTIKALSCIGDAEMKLGLRTAQQKAYDQTLGHYEASICHYQEAIRLCSITDPNPHVDFDDSKVAESDTKRLNAEKDHLALCLSISLPTVERLESLLLRHVDQLRRELSQSQGERDVVRGRIGDAGWNRSSPIQSRYAHRRQELCDQIRQIEAILDKIEGTAEQREALQQSQRQLEVEKQQRTTAAAPVPPRGRVRHGGSRIGPGRAGNGDTRAGRNRAFRDRR